MGRQAHMQAEDGTATSPMVRGPMALSRKHEKEPTTPHHTTPTVIHLKKTKAAEEEDFSRIIPIE